MVKIAIALIAAFLAGAWVGAWFASDYVAAMLGIGKYRCDYRIFEQ